MTKDNGNEINRERNPTNLFNSRQEESETRKRNEKIRREALFKRRETTVIAFDSENK